MFMYVCVYGYKIKTELLKEQGSCHHPSQIKEGPRSAEVWPEAWVRPHGSCHWMTKIQPPRSMGDTMTLQSEALCL